MDEYDRYEAALDADFEREKETEYLNSGYYPQEEKNENEMEDVTPC